MLPVVETDKINVQPNPSVGDIEFAGTGKGILEVSTLAGQIVMRREVTLPYRLNLRGWPEGLYLYKLRIGENMMSGKFVKAARE